MQRVETVAESAAGVEHAAWCGAHHGVEPGERRRGRGEDRRVAPGPRWIEPGERHERRQPDPGRAVIAETAETTDADERRRERKAAGRDELTGREVFAGQN
jgi:hypothetical protein